MRISTKGFKEAVAKLNSMAKATETQKFQQVLVKALDPAKQAVVANVHSVTGRTAAAIVVSAGKNPRNPSAYIKVDKSIASVIWRGRRFPYPYAVEALHPFFRTGILSSRAGVRRLVRDGIEDVLNPYVTSLSIAGEFS